MPTPKTTDELTEQLVRKSIRTLLRVFNTGCTVQKEELDVAKLVIRQLRFSKEDKAKIVSALDLDKVL